MFLVHSCGACALRSLPYSANPVPMPESIITVKNQRHRVRFLNKIKSKTDILSVFDKKTIGFCERTLLLSKTRKSFKPLKTFKPLRPIVLPFG